MKIERFFTKDIDGHPRKTCKWIKRDAIIKDNSKNEIVFEQRDVLTPEHWSQQAVNVVVSKYFRGQMHSAARETSIEQLIERVVLTITNWAMEQGYFDHAPTSSAYNIFYDELWYMVLYQYFSWNSPTWFNVGVPDEKPQVHACHILKVEDNMESIMQNAVVESRIFANGSGCGVNGSCLRSSFESLSGGGLASGPMSFFLGYDKFAGVIKSGGKTRRAATMRILNVDHPDVYYDDIIIEHEDDLRKIDKPDFITTKMFEEKKAKDLMAQGWPSDFNGQAYSTIAMQNANLSVRVTDEFMSAVEKNSEWVLQYVKDGQTHKIVKARDVIKRMAKGAHYCGDPAIQYHDTINDFNTCTKDGDINSSNPCAEYMFLDNTSCNLASLNLLKFINLDGEFDIERFVHCIKFITISMDVAIDRAWYASKELEEGAKQYRTLGLGYANLGAMLMALGLPYASNEAQFFCSAITSLMTSAIYLTSNKIAKKLGAFPRFVDNRASFTDVMVKHTRANTKLSKKFKMCDVKLNYMDNIKSIIDAAENHWLAVAQAAENEEPFRNAQASVLAPTGTIAFMMDCDTTGIEPELGLIKFKHLAGGGVLKIVNNQVAKALEKLGYEDYEVEEIIAYIAGRDSFDGAPCLVDVDDAVIEQCDELLEDGVAFEDILNYLNSVGISLTTLQERELHFYIYGTGTIESFDMQIVEEKDNDDNPILDLIDRTKMTTLRMECPYIRKNHLRVFDCSFVPPYGSRSLGYRSHLDMMAAAQPFLSGAISKTINMPERSTEDDIVQVFLLGWKLGLKAIAIYRDNSKSSQPLIIKHDKITSPQTSAAKPRRMRLPKERVSITHKFNIGAVSGYITVGLYPDGAPGEVFITTSKMGDAISGAYGYFASTLLSIALQYGVPLEAYIDKFENVEFRPNGPSGMSFCPIAKSIPDYLVKYLRHKFGKKLGIELKDSGVVADTIKIQNRHRTITVKGVQYPSRMACPSCGADTLYLGGTCDRCDSCGWSNGTCAM